MVLTLSHLFAQVAKVVNQGNLLPDQYVLELLKKRLSEGARKGEEGVLLDGFPRTRNQAESLLTFADVQLALNLSLREEVLPFCQFEVPLLLTWTRSAESCVNAW